MRYLFTTLLTHETEFYGRVGAELAERGHRVSYLSTSRHGVRLLGEQGLDAICVLDAIATLQPADLQAEVARIESCYGLPTIRDVYLADPPCAGKPEAWCVARTVGYFRALELLIDRIRPDVIVPEVGRETLRTAMHLIGVDRGIPVLFLFHTIFPRPLRLYVDTMHAPIVAPEELRTLSTDEAAELEAFRHAFTAAGAPIRPHRRVSLDPRRIEGFADLVGRKIRADADNEYLRPGRLLLREATSFIRGRAARLLYSRRDLARPFVYFPLHVADDYKIMRLTPHCADQASLVEQVADALPPGYDLVVKEHPLSIGLNRLSFLRRLRRRPNVRLVDPFESSHRLITSSSAVVVIGSTVGLEALLYEKPVLTLGKPFYSGYGITLDLDSFAQIRTAVPELLRFRPDPERTGRFLHAAMRHCHPGAPVLVDDSDANASRLAATLDEVGGEILSGRAAGAGRPRGPVSIAG